MVKEIGDKNFSRLQSLESGLVLKVGSCESLILNISNILHNPNEVERKKKDEIKFDWVLKYESSYIGWRFWYKACRNDSNSPKPMVPIGDKPILWHLMNFYASYGHNEFIVALGYKADVIKKFLNYAALDSDFTT